MEALYTYKSGWLILKLRLTVVHSVLWKFKLYNGLLTNYIFISHCFGLVSSSCLKLFFLNKISLHLPVSNNQLLPPAREKNNFLTLRLSGMPYDASLIDLMWCICFILLSFLPWGVLWLWRGSVIQPWTAVFVLRLGEGNLEVSTVFYQTFRNCFLLLSASLLEIQSYL